MNQLQNRISKCRNWKGSPIPKPFKRAKVTLNVTDCHRDRTRTGILIPDPVLNISIIHYTNVPTKYSNVFN